MTWKKEPGVPATSLESSNLRQSRQEKVKTSTRGLGPAASPFPTTVCWKAQDSPGM